MEDTQLPIETFVFLDLEATGLYSPGSRPRIAELSLVAVNRNLLAASCMLDEPRVLNKLTLCVYPKKPMDLGASNITKLYTDDLHWQKELDENFAASVELFLARLGPPVCLVAHNGNKYDFPLLRSELGMVNKPLRDDILCVDSLVMCRDLDSVDPVDPVRVILYLKTCRKSLNFGSNSPKVDDENGLEKYPLHIPQATPSKGEVKNQLEPSEMVPDPFAQSKKVSPRDDEMISTGNPRKKQKTSHEVCRRLLYSDTPPDSEQAEDNTCNEVESQQSFSIINPGNTPLSEGFLISNDMTGNGSSVCESNLSTEKNRTPKGINVYSNNTQRSSNRSGSESDTDTIPVIGDTESETMSTLQQMSTFRYDQCSFSSSASTIDLGKMDSMGVALLESQGTQVYTIQDPMPMDSQSSLPNSVSVLDQQLISVGSPESVADEALLRADICLDLQNAGVGNFQESVSDSTLGNLTIESQPSTGASPCDAQQETSCVQTENIETDEKADRNIGQCNNPTVSRSPLSHSPQRPILEPVPKDSPENRTIPIEKLQEIARLGTHAPKKQHRTKQKQTVPYRLSDLHQRILGYEPPRSHCAEDDAMALLRIFHRKAQDVMPWADTHAVPINSIPFMYPLQRKK